MCSFAEEDENKNASLIDHIVALWTTLYALEQCAHLQNLQDKECYPYKTKKAKLLPVDIFHDWSLQHLYLIMLVSCNIDILPLKDSADVLPLFVKPSSMHSLDQMGELCTLFHLFLIDLD